MDPASLLIGVIVGALVGAALAWLLLDRGFRSRAARLDRDNEDLKARLRSSEESRKTMSDTFAALAAEALRNNNQSFLQQAEQSFKTQLTEARGDLDGRKKEIENLIKPIREQLSRVESERQQHYGSLEQLIRSLQQNVREVSGEARNLTQALKTPQVRGRWGEMTLRRVAELAGMVQHCDFDEQVTLKGHGGQRPDMVIRLPNERLIVVDAKTPLDGYLAAVEAPDDEARQEGYKRHARQLRDRVRELSDKRYWDSLDATPEFAVLFLPGDFFLGAALQIDPPLQEEAMKGGVVIATPSTLISLLHAVAYGWRQEQLAENARQISELGREMYERLSTWCEHQARLRRSLESCVEHFNRGVGSLESRVLVSARRFRELGVGAGDELPVIDPVDSSLRVTSYTESGRGGEEA